MTAAPPAPPPPALVADDLTGACDAGVPFLTLGWTVTVSLNPLAPPPDSDLAVLATHTRNAPPEDAAATIRLVAAHLAAAGRHPAYKKLDSTLHGNPGAEIDALLDSGPHRGALVCPAFPHMGRRYLDGELLLGPERRPAGRNLLRKLQDHSRHRVVPFRLSDLRSTDAPDHLRSLLHHGPTLVACDAETEQDVHRAASLAFQLRDRLLPCGSTGMARHLAAIWRAETAPALPAPHPPPPLRSGHPAFVACIGSTSSVTQAQIQQLVLHRHARLEPLADVDFSTLPAALRNPAPLLFTLRLGSDEARSLPTLVSLLHQHPPAGLLLSGGDTAQLVCAVANTTQLALGGEVEPGVPWAVPLDGLLAGCLLITKAGGFGDSRTLVRCVDFHPTPAAPHSSPSPPEVP